MEAETEVSVHSLLKKVKDVSKDIKALSDEAKAEILKRLAQVIKDNLDRIMVENEKDLVRMDDSDPKKDRLKLTPERIFQLAGNVEVIAGMEDPTNKIILNRTMDNGLKLKKVTVPLGVVGIIYESRPNVTIDVAALCIRSGNAVVLRGGSDAEYSNKMLVKLIHEVFNEFGLSTDVLQLLPIDRKYVQEMLEANQYIDIIIPRGSQSLIDYVRENSKVPTIETGAGVCHTYVNSTAKLEKARDIVVNAKTDRPSVCNALDTILVDKAIAGDFIPMIAEGMQEYNVEIFADNHSYQLLESKGYPYLQHARESDYGREYLDFKCSVKVVEDIEEAMEHIRNYSSKHSEAIVAEDPSICKRFLNETDAAAVYTNASTRFTDGGDFGLGAEIGISTQKLHARGPFALEKLTTEKWIIEGTGQIK